MSNVDWAIVGGLLKSSTLCSCQSAMKTSGEVFGGGGKLTGNETCSPASIVGVASSEASCPCPARSLISCSVILPSGVALASFERDAQRCRLRGRSRACERDGSVGDSHLQFAKRGGSRQSLRRLNAKAELRRTDRIVRIGARDHIKAVRGRDVRIKGNAEGQRDINSAGGGGAARRPEIRSPCCQFVD